MDAQLDIQPGEQGCDAAAGSDCLRQVLISAPRLLWWGSACWRCSPRWRCGWASGTGGTAWPWSGSRSTWLPWLLYDDRPIFCFYAVLSLPFLVLSATLVAWGS